MKYRYVYGPVPSWRLGKSLGVDLVSQEPKVCSFDCVYCQLGRTRTFLSEPAVFIPTRAIMNEIAALPKKLKIDFITFSGTSEPTLAANLLEVIKNLKKTRLAPIAVLTNSSLFYKRAVANALLLADKVVAKLDAPDPASFKKINRPAKGISFRSIVNGLLKFRKKYKGCFALQIMFIKENKHLARKIAEISRKLMPDEVEINTPLRPCAVKPLSKKELAGIKKYFKGMNVFTVYEKTRPRVKPLDLPGTLKRRPKL